LALTAVVRLRLADAPLERDEGEYAYAGRLILEGTPPYAVAYNMKFPGTYYAYALILGLLGRTAGAVRVGLTIVNAVSIVLVWRIGRRLTGETGAAAAAVVFAILSLDRWVFGPFAHATHFVVLAVLGGMLALLSAIETAAAWRFVVSGALFGVAVLMKQHAIFFLPLAMALAASARDRAKALVLLAAGSVVPFVGVVAVLGASGVLGRFWLWTFKYAGAYVSALSWSEGWSRLRENLAYVTTATLPLWILAAAGLVVLWARPHARPTRIALTGLLAASILAICPGFYFREHYFIVVLPALALLAGVLASQGGRAGAVALALIAASAAVYAVRERSFLFSMSGTQLVRTTFGTNPFEEAVAIGKYIRERTGDADTIAVLGSEPEIYFYAGRRSATGYIYTYPLMEPQPYAHAMQAEMQKEIETAHPKYLVFSRIDVSWLASKESDQSIVRWTDRYIRSCYDTVGVADVVDDNVRRVAWDEGLRGFTPASADLVFTCRRKSDAPCVADP
jgi:hypothetical protein